MDIVSIADAVSVLEYLHKRELLCTHCGDNQATVKNEYHRRCEACRSPNARYEEVKVSTLEKCILGALKRWLASHTIDAQRADDRNATCTAGQG